MKKSPLFLIGIALIITSCKTYTITPESLKEQLTNSINPQEVEINNPLSYNSITYLSNNIYEIQTIDKAGNKTIISNSPSIEMKITLKNKKKYLFYFDTVTLKNDTLKGAQSRFIQSISKEIPLNSIEKIELQDGRKNFKYQ